MLHYRRVFALTLSLICCITVALTSNKIAVTHMPTLKDKIASMFIIGFRGTELDTETAHIIATMPVGGVILYDKDWKPLLAKQSQYDRNIVNPIQLKQLTQSLQTLAGDNNLLIAIDYEGGKVSRLEPERGFPKTDSAEALSKMNRTNRQALFTKMAKTMNEYGINVDFAPVVDLKRADNMLSQKERTFSNDPRIVTKLSKEFITIMKNHGIVFSLKHFPGHGSSSGDSHFGFVDVTNTWQPDELEPYKALIQDSNFDMIMTAHVVNRNLDPSGLPATLSKKILTNLLKGDLNFKGVIITDDMQMAAIEQHYTLHNALVKTINAGSDMMIFANQLGEDVTIQQLINEVYKAVQQGEISENRINDAYSRIIRLKAKISFTETQFSPTEQQVLTTKLVNN